jgi:hypothetical protein
MMCRISYENVIKHKSALKLMSGLKCLSQPPFNKINRNEIILHKNLIIQLFNEACIKLEKPTPSPFRGPNIPAGYLAGAAKSYNASSPRKGTGRG